jgi:hypothetical protein
MKNEEKQHQSVGTQVLNFFLMFIVITIFLFIMSFIVMILWNNGIRPATGAYSIELWHAFCIYALCTILLNCSCGVYNM